MFLLFHQGFFDYFFIRSLVSVVVHTVSKVSRIIISISLQSVLLIGAAVILSCVLNSTTHSWIGMHNAATLTVNHFVCQLLGLYFFDLWFLWWWPRFLYILL